MHGYYEYSSAEGCAIHAFVLMTNHVHLLITPSTVESAGVMMKRLGQRYVQCINRSYRRSGTLWEGRFPSCLTQEEDYVLGCYRYIESNPVRAGMVDHPAAYNWSSFRANAQGEFNPYLQGHACYQALGKDDVERHKAYRELFRHQLEPGVVDQIREATNGNFALGSSRFARDVSLTLGRRVSRGQSGRPRKYIDVESKDLFND